MLTHQWRRNGSWAALVAGSTGLLGIVFLALFFAVEFMLIDEEAAQGITRFHLFGFLSDLLPIFSYLSALVVVVVMVQLERAGALELSVSAALLGIAGNLVLIAKRAISHFPCV
jgi:hypothetical protein